MSRIPGAVCLILALLASGQVARGQQGQQGTAWFTQWGTKGEPGSFHIWFEDRGASVWSIWLTDHFQNVAARDKPEHELEDYYRAVQNLQWREGLPNEEQDLAPPFLLFEPKETFGFKLREPVGNQMVPRIWERQELADGGVRFRLDGGQGMVLEKVYRSRPQSRIFELEISLHSKDDPGDLSGQQFKVDLLGLALVNKANENVIGNPAVNIAQQMRNGQPGEVTVRKPESGGQPTSLVEAGPGPIWFAGSTNRFFGAFMFPLDEDSSWSLFDVLTESMPPTDNGEIKAWSVPRTRYRLRMRVPQEGETTTVRLGCYLGPKSYRVFDERPEYERFAEVMASDLRPYCFCAIPGAAFMASVLLKLLGFFQGIAVNWGVAIIMLTLMVRGLLVPLNFRMQKSMRAFGVKMQRLKPQMDEIKKRYEKDPKAYQRKMMEFNREHKIVPPIGGCLPIFLTMPVWIGLFTALRVAYDLRQEPFLLWIDDLSRSDALIQHGLSWMPFHFDHFNLLPLIMMGLWFWAQSSTPLPADPQQRQMMKIMRYLPFLFGIMLYNYASGLMLYMITSSSWALVEMRVTRKILGPMPAAGGIAPMTPM